MSCETYLASEWERLNMRHVEDEREADPVEMSEDVECGCLMETVD